MSTRQTSIRQISILQISILQISKRQNIAVYSTDSRKLPPETEMRLLVIYGE